MRFTSRLAVGAVTLAVVAASAVGAFGATARHHRKAPTVHQAGAGKLHFHLTPSSPQLAACMPRVHIDGDLQLTTDRVGFDVLTIHGRHLPPRTTFTTFLIEQTASPFGAAEY